MKEQKLWSGRFKQGQSPSLEAFGCSLQDDIYLFEADIQASRAHLIELKNNQIVSEKEFIQINNSLTQLLIDFQENRWQPSPQHEDIHMNIEAYLIEKLGETGKKIHTGRSRNDQVVTAFKLTIQKNVHEVMSALIDFCNTLLEHSQTHLAIVLPGYTHLQKAQPIRLSHYFMAYFEMFYRDATKLNFFKTFLKEMPLGSGALAGNAFSLNRKSITQVLEQDLPTANSIDSVADRDYVLDILYAYTQIMLHLSRLSEDLIIWSSEEFNYITLSDDYSTGSSIMPQKKNPDVCELTRGKTGRAIGSLVGMATILKGLPMAYNRDLQEDKHLYYESFETVISCLKINNEMLKKLKINSENMVKASKKGYLLATDIAEYLVKKGMAFRDAHAIVGKIVAYSLDSNKNLMELKIEELQKFSKLIESDLILSPESSVESKTSYGGTAQKSVLEQINAAKIRIGQIKNLL